MTTTPGGRRVPRRARNRLGNTVRSAYAPRNEGPGGVFGACAGALIHTGLFRFACRRGGSLAYSGAVIPAERTERNMQSGFSRMRRLAAGMAASGLALACAAQAFADEVVGQPVS